MKCCWWNLWVLNKSMHKLSSTGIKTSRVQGCLYRNWVSSPVCDVLWNRKWSCYTWLQPSSTPIPRCFLGSFMKKVQNKTCKWRSSQCTMGKGWTYSWLVHTHIRILEPSSYKDSTFFPDSGSLVTSSMWEFDSLAIYGVECCFSVQPILNWKNSLGKCYKSSFPISFILLQLLFQNCLFSEVQYLYWCYHFWTWILYFLYWNKISRRASIYVDLALTTSSPYSPGQRAAKTRIIADFRKGKFFCYAP